MLSQYPLTPLPAQPLAAPAAGIQEQYQQRCAQLFAFTDTTTMSNYFIAAAKLHRRTDIAGGVKIISELLEHPAASSSGMFVSNELMAAYLYGRDVLPEEIRQRIWEKFRTRPLYRGDTENHWVMYYTGLYLAAQTWPNFGGDHWYTGKSSQANFQEAQEWLNLWIKTTTTIGQGEFDSPTYHIVFLAPMLVLQEFAHDPAMKKQAEKMVHYLLADFAAEHLQGMYCGAHSRDYPYDAIAPKNAPMTAWAWLMFGQTGAVMRPEILAAALSSYRLPEIIYQIATDRSQPYVHTETKRVRNLIRFNDERNPPVYKYTYMTKDFALGSMQGGAILQPIQQHLWDVTFVSDKPHCSLFTVHPYVSAHELGSFFPEEMKFTVDEVARFHTYYGKEGKWVSSSPYAQTFQHRNAIIVLYDIPPGTQFEHIDGFFPKDLEQRVVSLEGKDLAGRWIFCQGGSTYIAYLPLKPYQWIEESECWRLRSPALRNGCIVEVSAAEAYPSFEAFQQQITGNAVEIYDSEETWSVGYTTSDGDQMEFTFGEERSLNGEPVDFGSYKLFNGPFLHGEVGSGRLELRYHEMSLVLDFND